MSILLLFCIYIYIYKYLDISFEVKWFFFCNFNIFFLLFSIIKKILLFYLINQLLNPQINFFPFWILDSLCLLTRRFFRCLWAYSKILFCIKYLPTATLDSLLYQICIWHCFIFSYFPWTKTLCFIVYYPAVFSPPAHICKNIQNTCKFFWHGETWPIKLFRIQFSRITTLHRGKTDFSPVMSRPKIISTVFNIRHKIKWS